MKRFPRMNNFSKITWINAFTGIALLVWQWYAGMIPLKVQLLYFAIMIGATGIPHGALDHIIAKTNAVLNGQTFAIQQFLGRYVIAILIYATSWIFFPGISLIIFLIISAWHFGETDLSNAAHSWRWNTSRLLWGCFVLLVILLSHFQEMEEIVLRITKNAETAISLLAHLNRMGIYYAGTSLLLLTTSAFLANKRHPLQISWHYILNLVLVMLICSQLPLLPSFALYFGGWHAIRSFEIIFTFLHAAKEETAIEPLTMWKNALPMTFLAAFGFIFMAFIWNGVGMSMDPLPAIFIFLSIITVPHLDVMDKLIQRGSKV